VFVPRAKPKTFVVSQQGFLVRALLGEQSGSVALLHKIRGHVANRLA
jgi:hypothetical protein